jgi:hypothetical protein
LPFDTRPIPPPKRTQTHPQEFPFSFFLPETILSPPLKFPLINQVEQAYSSFPSPRNMPPPLELPPLQDAPPSLTPRPLEPAVSPLLHEPRVSVHGVSRPKAQLHALQGGMRGDCRGGHDVC